MVHILGQPKPFEVRDTVLVNRTVKLSDAFALTIKIGLQEIAKDRYRVWYYPLTLAPDKVQTFLLTPPDGYIKDRALIIANNVKAMLECVLEQAVMQVTHDASAANNLVIIDTTDRC